MKEIIDINKIEDIEFDGIDHGDYPDFCDAYVSSAVYPTVENPTNENDWRELTIEELEWLNATFPDFVYEKLMDYLN